MRRAEREALALGLLHGPAELVPVSSSGHVAALPWLLGWEVAGWDGARRKELEVALHAGAAAAWLLVLPAARACDPALLAAAVAPPALVGYALERRIEARLGTPATLAAGLLAGGAALVLADRAPGARATTPMLRSATGSGSGSPRRRRSSPASRATARRWRRRGRAASPARTRRGCRGRSRCRCCGRDRAEGLARGGRNPERGDRGARGLTRPAQPGLTRPAHAGSPGPPNPGSPGPPNPASSRSPTALRVRPLALGAGAAFASTLVAARAIGIERRAPAVAVGRVAGRARRRHPRRAPESRAMTRPHLRTRRRRHGRGRPGDRRARRRAAHDRHRPRLAHRPAARPLRRRARGRAEPGHRGRDRRRRLQADRRRAHRPLRHGRDRLHRDERQRRHLRRRRADRRCSTTSPSSRPIPASSRRSRAGSRRAPSRPASRSRAARSPCCRS